MNRRTFLTRLASTVAAIALAPQLCRMGAAEMPRKPVYRGEYMFPPGFFNYCQTTRQIYLLS